MADRLTHMTQAKVEDYAKGLSDHAERLAFTATLDGAGKSCARDDQVRKILARAAELVRGASALGRDRNAVALGVLARTIVESLILLLWVEISEENALHQSKAGLAELTRVARVNMEQGTLKVWNRKTGQDATAEFLKSDRFKGLTKSKKVVDMAKEAGVEHLYDVLYRVQSMATHGHEFGAEGADQDSALIVEMQAIGAMIKAIGHAGIRWLLNRERTDNESLRTVLGIDDKQ
jgi:hypothetical protein